MLILAVQLLCLILAFPNYMLDSPRLFFATWWIFITILTSFYTANLTAFLTLSEFTLTIQTPKDISQHNRRWMADKGGYTEALVQHEDIFRMLRKSSSVYGNFIEDTVDDKLRWISSGTVYISEKRKAKQFMLKDYMEKVESKLPEGKRCTYVLTPNSILKKTVAFGYSKNSTLRALFDPLLTYFVHGGIIGHLLDENLPLTTICPLNLATSERKLKNADLMTTYKIVLVGFGSSFIAFIGEVIYRMTKKGFKSKKQKTNVSQYGKNQLMRFPFQNNESKTKFPLENNFVISQYYRDIMLPYNFPYRNCTNFSYIQERNNRTLMHSGQPTNFLFQYTN